MSIEELHKLSSVEKLKIIEALWAIWSVTKIISPARLGMKPNS